MLRTHGGHAKAVLLARLPPSPQMTLPDLHTSATKPRGAGSPRLLSRPARSEIALTYSFHSIFFQNQFAYKYPLRGAYWKCKINEVASKRSDQYRAGKHTTPSPPAFWPMRVHIIAIESICYRQKSTRKRPKITLVTPMYSIVSQKKCGKNRCPALAPPAKYVRITFVALARQANRPTDRYTPPSGVASCS